MERLTHKTTAGHGIWDGSEAIFPSDIKRQNPIHFRAIIEAFNKLAAYEDAEKQGRLQIHPYASGQSGFVLTGSGIKPGEIDIVHGHIWVDVYDELYDLSGFYHYESFHLTREAAEEMLKKDVSNNEMP